MFHAAHSAAVPGQVAKLEMQVEEMTAACLRNKSRAVLIASFCLVCAAAAAQITQTSTYAAPAVPTPSSIQMQMQQSQDPFAGGRVTEKATPGVLQLGLLDAIERGLRNNLGLLLSGYGTPFFRIPCNCPNPLVFIVHEDFVWTCVSGV